MINYITGPRADLAEEGRSGSFARSRRQPWSSAAIRADHYLGPELAEPEHNDVPNLDRVERLPDASHWVHHDEAERVTQLLTDFFAPALAA